LGLCSGYYDDGLGALYLSRQERVRKPTRVRCLKCRSVIKTVRDGEFRSCRCKSVGLFQHKDGRYEVLFKAGVGYEVIEEHRRHYPKLED